MKRIAVTLIVFACLLGFSACADTTAPLFSGGGKKAPMGATHTRYILASGDILPPNCEDLGNGFWLCDDDPEATRSTNGTHPGQSGASR
ncbi:MAG: hypothetical protein ACJ77R_09060 [Gemmatimonadaceae bacterium]